MARGAVRIVLAGGGTAGHVYPALAIAEIARRSLGAVELLYVGVRGRAEEHAVPAASIPIEYVEVRGLSLSPLRLPGFVLALARGWSRARSILRGFDPDLVVSTGGFSSAPAVFAATTLRRSGRPAILVHEQNAVPGRMNRVAGRLADRVCTSFEASGSFFPGDKVVHTGYPVRGSIQGHDRARARRSLDIPHDAFTVLAFGGSGGARSLNRGLVEALPALLDRDGLHVIHGTGRYFADDYDPRKDTARRVDDLGIGESQRARYHPVEYIEDMGQAYAAADLVVCRAGAGTLAEVGTACVPSILVPKIGLPHEHQLANARDLVSSGCAWMIEERDDPARPGTKRLQASALADRILEVRADPSLLDRVRGNLARRPLPDTEGIMSGILIELAGVRT